MMPWLTLILPCYNVEKYVARCVQSILTQDFVDYEVILVDDGSTDGTAALCDRFARENGCIRVIHKANGGLTSARNAGLDAAQGQYVWFIDSDDWIEQGALTLLQQCCADTAAEVVKFDHYRVDASTQELVCAVDEGLYTGEQLDMLRRRAFAGAGQYVLSACMHIYRRALLVEHGLRFVSERQVGSEDYLLNLQVLLHADSLYMLHRPLYSYERRDGSLTQTYKPDLPQRYAALKTQIEIWYEAHQALEKYAPLIERFFLWHLLVGTCVTQAYDAVPGAHTMQEARREVRRILALKACRHAVRHSCRSGLSWKKKVQLLAMRLQFEPLLYYLYALKPARKR
ncbi:MAG: glycosyltransferase family 2 protein [Clostridia bacterium]|nr:glycosyltransferase family 2 protein [Clostridia bacterium]